MDNQPTQPNGASPRPPVRPATNPNPAASRPTRPITSGPATSAVPTTPVAPTTPTTAAPTQPVTPNPMSTPTPPTDLPPSGDIILESGKKKRKKGRIFAIIICILLLLGGGAFATAYFIYNQPNNIIMSALGNFLNAKQIEVGGDVNLTIANSEQYGIESININLDEKAVGVSNTTTASVNIKFADGTNANAIELGEVLLNNGVLYIEANGLGDFYDNVLRDNLAKTLIEQATNNYQSSTTVSECHSSGDTTDCRTVYNSVTLDPVAQASITSTVNDSLDQIGELIDSIDGQWIEVPIDDLLGSGLLGPMSSETRNSISNTYNCTLNVLNNTSNYSGELSNLYNQNSFINMSAGDNSFYNISLDATKLAGYLNGVQSTKLYSDLTGCFNVTPTNTNITADNVSSLVQYLPQVSAKFDGIFDHHLTELKLTEQNDIYTLSSDLKFSYPHNITVNAPTNTRSVIDVIKTIQDRIPQSRL